MSDEVPTNAERVRKALVPQIPADHNEWASVTASIPVQDLLGLLADYEMLRDRCDDLEGGAEERL